MNQIINYKQTKVNFSDEGKGGAVVLLHGFLENMTIWGPISLVLSKKHRVISIDLFGHGKTENHGYVHSMEDQARMVRAVLNHLKLRKCVMVGHSMGGYVALSFVKLFPDKLKGICLMNSTALADTVEKKRNRERGITAVKRNSKTFVRIAIPLLFSEENRIKLRSEIDKIIVEALQISPQSIVAALKGMKIREDSTAIYKTANFPMLLIVGKNDSALNYESLIEEVRGTKVDLVEFPDGHMSYLENKMAVLKTLGTFIKRCN
jgi:pimeloyl-ACP methyl ester carboxylesterase